MYNSLVFWFVCWKLALEFVSIPFDWYIVQYILIFFMELIPEIEIFLVRTECGDKTFVANIEEMHILSCDWFDIFKIVLNSRSSNCNWLICEFNGCFSLNSEVSFTRILRSCSIIVSCVQWFCRRRRLFRPTGQTIPDIAHRVNGICVVRSTKFSKLIRRFVFLWVCDRIAGIT